MELSEQEKAMQEGALAFARKNKKAIARRLTDKNTYLPEQEPVSVFMAGSPGAGKTEASLALLGQPKIAGSKILRIDPDELRKEFDDYRGSNSWLFEGGVSILVEKIHDLVLKQKQSFLLDGTLSIYEIARKNIGRSLKKGRVVQILYVYQKPEVAWAFVQKRECLEGRRIEPETFIEQYFAARHVVNGLKNELGKAIKVDLLLKENDGSDRLYKAGVDQVDNHIPEKYTVDDLKTIVGIGSSH